MKKHILIGLIVIAVLLSGCAKGYKKLSSEQQQIVDAFYTNRSMWDVPVVEYSTKASGENVIRNISFTSYEGNVCLQVQYALDSSASRIVSKYFVYRDGSVELVNTKLAEIMGHSIGKVWYTTWSESEKKDFMAEKLLDYYKK